MIHDVVEAVYSKATHDDEVGVDEWEDEVFGCLLCDGFRRSRDCSNVRRSGKYSRVISLISKSLLTSCIRNLY